MSTVEIGAYWLLICECWDKGNQLPNDLDELADIARMKRADFEKVWERRIKKCFQFDESKNVFRQKRLGEEIKKQKAWSKKKSEAGKKGMASRWKEKDKADNTAITVLGGDITQHNSPSLSLSSTSSQEEEKREETPQAASPPKKGTRIPEPFMLTKEMRAYAADRRPSVDVIEETEKFVNYWKAKSGRDACKLDWYATWQNWILNAKGNGNGTNSSNNTKPTSLDRIQDTQRVIDQYPTEAELGGFS